MFNKNKFAIILNKINSTYDTMTDFAKNASFDRTYISKYINQKLNNPPSPKILLKIAKASNNTVTYEELMEICGYQFATNSNLENETFSMFQTLINEYTNTKVLEESITYFQKYIQDLSINLEHRYSNLLYLNNYVSMQINCIIFMLFHDTFLKYLISNEIIDFSSSCSYTFINWLNKYEAFENSEDDKNCLLFCSSNKHFSLKRNHIEIITIAKKFITFIKLSYLTNFTNQSSDILNIFKGKINSNLISHSNILENVISSHIYNIPIYGQISAGLPNWAEECLEGHLPIDPNLMNIINPEECFFLRVNGESMNKVIRNGAYALIRKQDIVENGDIAAVLVNGDDATIKKFTRQNELVILEPMSNDDSFTLQIYDKNTSIKILGKYIGKFEINN